MTENPNQDDDVTGHGRYTPSRPEDGKSGHGLRPQLDGDDDVVGHGAPMGATFPKATGAPSLTGALKDKSPTLDDQDDVSGHGTRSGRLQRDGDDDTEGHASRGRV